MRPISLKREAENAERREVMVFVRRRDGDRCVGRTTNPATGQSYLPERCYGPLNGHEIITRAQGGSITDPANIVLVCDGHNRWADLNRDEAIARGFRQLRYDPLSSNVADRLPHLSAPGLVREPTAKGSAHSATPYADVPPVPGAVFDTVTMRDPEAWAALEAVPFVGVLHIDRFARRLPSLGAGAGRTRNVVSDTSRSGTIEQ